MILFPGGSLVSPSAWVYFGEEKSPSEVPILQKAANSGGWITLKNSVKTCSYHSDVQTLTTPNVHSGLIYHTLVQFGELGKELPAEFWENVLKFTRAKLHKSLEQAVLFAFIMGGKIANDPDGKQTCLTSSIRRARYFGTIGVRWRPEFGEEGKNAARVWAKGIAEILKPYNYEALRYAAPDMSIGSARDVAGYGMDRYPKLRALKKKYDPTNLFCNNANIAPADD